jgi:hypothetical protein
VSASLGQEPRHDLEMYRFTESGMQEVCVAGQSLDFGSRENSLVSDCLGRLVASYRPIHLEIDEVDRCHGIGSAQDHASRRWVVAT